MNIPNAISLFRLAMSPVLLILAWAGQTIPFLTLLVISFLSDAIDGVIARRFRMRTELGARLDSYSDFFLYSTLGVGGWLLWPDLVEREYIAMSLLAASLLLPVLIGLIKFRKPTSYHTRAVKLSAVLIVPACLVLFAGGPVWPFRVAVAVCVYAAVEQILITVMVKSPLVDTPTLWHALRGRKAE